MTTAIIGVIGVIIGHLVTRLNSLNTIKNENITKERTKWREEIRELSNKFTSKKILTKHDIFSFRNSFAIRLNPNDANDQLIIEYFDYLLNFMIFKKISFINIEYALNTVFYIKNDNKLTFEEDKTLSSDNKINAYYRWDDLISLLLKHDWERSKLEADHFKQTPQKLISMSLVLYVYVLLILKFEEENLFSSNFKSAVKLFKEQPIKNLFYISISFLIVTYIIKPTVKSIVDKFLSFKKILDILGYPVRKPIRANNEILETFVIFIYFTFIILFLIFMAKFLYNPL